MRGRIWPPCGMVLGVTGGINMGSLVKHCGHCAKVARGVVDSQLPIGSPDTLPILMLSCNAGRCLLHPVEALELDN
jgi:hypothetical protein